jgi:hypothetical protein
MDNKWLIESEMVFQSTQYCFVYWKRVLHYIANHDYSVVFEASLRISDSGIRLHFLSLIIILKFSEISSYLEKGSQLALVWLTID